MANSFIEKLSQKVGSYKVVNIEFESLYNVSQSYPKNKIVNIKTEKQFTFDVNISWSELESHWTVNLCNYITHPSLEPYRYEVLGEYWEYNYEEGELYTNDVSKDVLWIAVFSNELSTIFESASQEEIAEFTVQCLGHEWLNIS